MAATCAGRRHCADFSIAATTRVHQELCAEQRFIVVRAGIDGVGGEEAFDLVGYLAMVRCAIGRRKAFENTVEEWAVRNASVEVENEALEPIRKHGELLNWPVERRNLHDIKRINLRQEARRIGVLAVIGPMHRPPSRYAIVDDDRAITDLRNRRKLGRQNRDEQRRRVVIDDAVIVRGDQFESVAGFGKRIRERALDRRDRGTVLRAPRRLCLSRRTLRMPNRSAHAELTRRRPPTRR